MIRPRVYVAGPLTEGGTAPPERRAANVRRACHLADRVWEIGGVPFVPHLSELWEEISPKNYEWWMSYDFHWVRACDILLRMNGSSSGANREEEFAKARHIPVVYSLKSLEEEIKIWQTARTNL